MSFQRIVRVRGYANMLVSTGLALSLFACGGDDGDEPESASSLAGKIFILEIPRNNWTEPRDVGRDIGDFVPQFALEVVSDSGGSLAVNLGTARGGTQDTCTATQQVSATSAQLGPLNLPIHLVHTNADVRVNATAYNLTMRNVLPGDSPATMGELTTTMDMRELYPMFTLIPEPSPDNVCMALTMIEETCEPCPTDGATYCLSIKAERAGAVENPSFSLESISAGSLSPDCAN
jgi:hypothetical protein